MKNKHLHLKTFRICKKIFLKGLITVFALFQVLSANAQAVVEDSATSEGDATSASVPRPDPVMQDDLLILGLMVEKGSGVSVTTVPPGWVLVGSQNNGTDAGMRIYRKEVGAGAEPMNYTFGFSTSTKWCSGISRISNADLLNPLDFRGETGSGSSVTAASVTTTTDNALVLFFYTNKKAATYTPHGSTTEVYDDPNGDGGLPSNMMASFVQVMAGDTGNKTATASEGESWVAMSLGINELGSLPVELVSYSGHAMERSNMLKWQTASEENTMSFIVERSLNGATDFREIDRVDAFGNSSTLRSYEVEDLNPVSLAYYRLRIVDFDGTFEFSDIIAVERSKTEIDLVEVFPIPAEEEVTVLIHARKEGKALMILTDFLGRKVKEEKIELKSGINRYTFNWDEHETNFYYLTVDNGKEKIAKKILRASRD